MEWIKEGSDYTESLRDIVKRSNETQAYIVCDCMRTAKHIEQESLNMELSIPFPITFDEFLGRKYYGKGIKGFIIYEAEKLIQSLSKPNVRVIASTYNEPPPKQHSLKESLEELREAFGDSLESVCEAVLNDLKSKD